MPMLVLTGEKASHQTRTLITAVHDGLPRALSPADNELGWREALSKLAELVEAS